MVLLKPFPIYLYLMSIRKIILEEMGDFDWTDDIEPQGEFEIGGYSGDLPITKVSIGSKVLSYNGDYEFTIETLKKNSHGEVIAVWGSDIPHHDRFVGNGDRNHHYIEFLRKP